MGAGILMTGICCPWTTVIFLGTVSFHSFFFSNHPLYRFLPNLPKPRMQVKGFIVYPTTTARALQFLFELLLGY